MTKRLAGVEDVRAVRTINGASVAVLEARCRPLEDRTQDPEHWRQRSAAGFLARHSSGLLQTIEDDWAAVHSVLRTTHRCLAAALRELYALVPSPGPEHVVARPALLWQQEHRRQSIVLRLQRQRYNAPQWSPFGTLPLRINSLPMAGDTEHCWDEELLLTNEELGLSLTVATGVVDFVEEIGFFEGGDANPYRVDPLLLAAALSFSSAQPAAERPSWMRVNAAERAEAVGRARAQQLGEEAAPVLAAAQQQRDPWAAEFAEHVQKRQQQTLKEWADVAQRLRG